jgi:hypothetical protein
MAMSTAGTGSKNGCAGEDQQNTRQIDRLQDIDDQAAMRQKTTE